MRFQQYYLDCLSQASYLIGDETTGRAVVVDPRRDVEEYLRDAEAMGLRIELVIETHFHADFVSGHLELAAATGAEIAFGSAAETEFPIRHLRDGERISLGEVTLEVLETPGHTPESICLVVWEHPEDEIPYGVLTGDTLFIGDVGRPDLLASVGFTAEEMASRLYDSLHDKLLRLPDETRVFPAHGAGSACGKSLSTETVSTIGEQKRTNYALRPMTREEFVRLITEGQPIAPGYFSFDARRNREARGLLSEHEAPERLDLERVRALCESGAVVLDTRDPADFAAAHLDGAINVGLGGRFAEMVGAVVEPGTPIVLVSEPGSEVEAKVRLARIGYDTVEGFLSDPYRVFQEHPEVVVRSSRITAAELADILSSDAPRPLLVDVRNPAERSEGVIDGALPIPLAELPRRAGELLSEEARSQPVVFYCASGYRSSIAASLLSNLGHPDVSDLLGGYAAWTSL